MRVYQKMIGAVLTFCMLTTVCATAASDSITEENSFVSVNAGNIIPMASNLILDSSISSAGTGWYQEKHYTSYRVWVENTSQYKMTVTITEPNGTKRNFTVDAGKNKSYSVNGVSSGFYRLSFNTGGKDVSGTVRVRVADVSLA